ncbi:MAG: phosphatase PAP2 family protein [Variibacter sp.]
MHRSAQAWPLDEDVQSLGRLDRSIWLLIAAVACVVFLSPLASGFQVGWRTFLAPAAVAAAFTLATFFYTRIRPDRRLASALGGTAQLIAFAAVAAPLSYLAAALNFPLRDGLFDAADRALGFDWAALLAWMNARPSLFAVLDLAYASFLPQAAVTVLCLSFRDQAQRLRTFMLAFVATTLITIAISGVLPAHGVWMHQGLQAEAGSILPASHTSWAAFGALRDGTLRLLVASGSEGIITFPSLHAALGVIFLLALWRVPFVRWAAVVVNGLMVAATPIDGSHYLVDVIAGVATALTCWYGAHAFARRRPRLGDSPFDAFAHRPRLDHDDFGSNRSKIMNVIDFHNLERDAGGKPLRTFPHPAPAAGE